MLAELHSVRVISISDKTEPETPFQIQQNKSVFTRYNETSKMSVSKTEHRMRCNAVNCSLSTLTPLAALYRSNPGCFHKFSISLLWLPEAENP